jgi:hypothetical protein
MVVPILLEVGNRTDAPYEPCAMIPVTCSLMLEPVRLIMAQDT